MRQTHQPVVKTNVRRKLLLSSIVAGKAITEGDVADRIMASLPTEGTSKGKSSSRNKAKNDKLRNSTTNGAKPKQRSIKRKQVNDKEVATPVAGPSGINRVQLVESDDSEDTYVCCTCKAFYPPKSSRISCAIVNWGQCDSCGHWTHLAFCSSVTIIHNNAAFLCPHCEH